MDDAIALVYGVAEGEVCGPETGGFDGAGVVAFIYVLDGLTDEAFDVEKAGQGQVILAIAGQGDVVAIAVVVVKLFYFGPDR